METFLQFAVQNWLMWLLLATILLVLLIEEVKSRFDKTIMIPPEDMIALINHKDAVIIDIRNTELFEKGHVIGALNMASTEVANQFKETQQYIDKPVVIICQRGRDCLKVAAHLRKQGFLQVKSLLGGIEEWKNRGMPLVKEN